MDGTEVAAEDRRMCEAAYPREHWHAALAASRLGDKPIGARVLDADIALYRGADRRPHALQDRCAHRGVALHLGEVKEGVLACPYHGWRYGAGGACVHIPSLTDGVAIAKGVGVRAYPCAEADGYVWVWTGQGAPAAPPPPPIAEFERFDWVQGSMALACQALAAIENNIDWCHPVFAYPHTHGMYFMNQAMGFRDQSVELRRTEQGLVVFQPPADSENAPVPDHAFTVLSYEPPDRVTVAFNAPQGAARIVMHMVPTGPASCRQEWMMSTGPATLGSARLTWTDEPHVIPEQDRALMESAQKVVDADSHAFERSVEADAPTLLARRIDALACEGRWPGEAERLPFRRLLSVRT
jgi:phenylpropionate dioxygenase-like ring-hydroxylating dioxygenase large terminal subunit